MFNRAWVTDNDRMRRHITINITVRSNQHIVANCNIPNYRCIYTDPNIIANCWDSLTNAPILLAYGYPLVNITIIANFNLIINGNSVRMTDI